MSKIYNIVVASSNGSLESKTVKAASVSAVAKRYGDNLVKISVVRGSQKSYTHRELILNGFYKKEFLSLIGKYKALLRIPASAVATHGEDWEFDESISLEFPANRLALSLSSNNVKVKQMMADFEKFGEFRLEPGSDDSYLYLFSSKGNGIFAKDPWA